MQITITALVLFAVGTIASVGRSPSTNNASPQSQRVTTVQDQDPAGEMYCCKNKEDIEADGILGNLLAKGLLNNVLGTGDSACAKFSLIENLNILGFTKDGVDGPVCDGTTAYCPSNGDDCQPVA